MFSIFPGNKIFAGSRRILFCLDLFFFLLSWKMGWTRGKRTINTQEPDGLPPKRKRGKATEVVSSGSQADGPATEGYWPEEVKARSCGYSWKCDGRGTNAKQGWHPKWGAYTNSGSNIGTKQQWAFIRRQDIASLAQENSEISGNHLQYSRYWAAKITESFQQTTECDYYYHHRCSTECYYYYYYYYYHCGSPTRYCSFQAASLDSPSIPSNSRQLHSGYQAHARLTPRYVAV